MLVASVSFLAWLGVVVLTMMVAKRRYRDPVLWGALAMFLSFIALLLLVMSDESRRGRGARRSFRRGGGPAG